MTIFARVDKNGIVRCGWADRNGLQNCQCRFGEIITQTISGAEVPLVQVDKGWRIPDAYAPNFNPFYHPDAHHFLLNTYNLRRYENAKRNRALDTWRAKSKSKATKKSYSLAFPWPGHGQQIYAIVCPDHGVQIMDGAALVDAARDIVRTD